ncbi:MAG: serine/threonine protein kinase [Deltaproteobacteria bacterium]|nr:serine/threonine protein kinase [Deltaproteobacteria bacterium]
MSEPTGEVLADRFELAGELGRGGFSVVFEAQDRKLGQRVALKVLVPPPVSAEIALERLRREVRAIRSVSHPNIVTVFDLVEAPDRAFVVMEKIAGLDLAAYVAKHGPLRAEDAARLAAEVAGALSAAHRKGMLHRDLKPQNVLVELDGGVLGRARLVDFGSARLEGEASLTRTGGFVGTLDYAAPEVFAGERGDARSDVYGLGMTMYFVLTGGLPKRASPHLPPEPSVEGHRPRSIVSELPDWIDAIVARATHEDRRARFPTAEAMAEALEQKQLTLPVKRSRAEFCLVCGRPEATRAGICARCDSSAPAKEGFVFVRTSKELEAIARTRLAAMVGAPTDEIDAVVSGRRALSAAGRNADRVTRKLLEAGIPATVASEAGAFALLPPSFRWMNAAVAGAGVVTAVFTGSLLGYAGPPLAMVLLGLAVRGSLKPLLAPSGRGSPLPRKLEALIDGASVSIESDAARGLLLDVVELARNALEKGQVALDAALEREVLALVEGAVSAAIRLGRLDRAVAVIERRKDRSLGETLERAQRARDALNQQLLEVVANLARAVTAGPVKANLLIDHLVERNRELGEELAAREEAMKELAGFSS